MMGRIFWFFTGLCVAAAVHLAYVLFVPGLLFQRSIAQLFGGLTANTFFVMKPDTQVKLLPSATAQDVVGLCLLDLDKGKIVISAQVPRSLWTLSIYSQSGEQVYEINDVQAGDSAFTIELSRAKSLLQQLSGKQDSDDAGQIENIGWHAELPERRGVAVLWVPVADAQMRAALAQTIQGTSCKTKGA